MTAPTTIDTQTLETLTGGRGWYGGPRWAGPGWAPAYYYGAAPFRGGGYPPPAYWQSAGRPWGWRYW